MYCHLTAITEFKSNLGLSVWSWRGLPLPTNQLPLSCDETRKYVLLAAPEEDEEEYMKATASPS